MEPSARGGKRRKSQQLARDERERRELLDQFLAVADTVDLESLDAAELIALTRILDRVRLVKRVPHSPRLRLVH